MLSTTIKSEISSLWDKFWSGGIANPLTAIEQISYLLFMKRLDEVDLKRKADADFLGQTYISIFEGKDNEGNDNQKKRWSYFKHLEGGEMLKHVQTQVFPFIKELKNGNQVFSDHMKDAVFIIPKPSLLVEAVNIIDKIYDEIDKEQKEGEAFQDTQGDVYEYLLSEIASAGKNGQFRTPRHIIQMIASLVNPKLGEEICDPACGTGGFLLGAYQHILTQHTSEQYLQKDENGIVKGLLGDKLTDERQWKVLREKTFYGFDFDTTMVRIGLMNLMLHGIDHPNIDYMDTLSKKYSESNKYDVVMANPPFKGSIDKGDINEDLSLQTTKTELLFVNRIINMLRLGGRAGVIVPDGVVTGDISASKQLREMIVNNNQLEAVIALPHFTFKPYASVATYVLVFVKGGVTDKVWMYIVEKDGYSDGSVRSYEGNSELPDVVLNWNNRNNESYKPNIGKHGFVTKEQIIKSGYELSPKSHLRVDNTLNLENYVSLGEIATIEKGTASAQKIETGEYTLITTAEDYKTCKEYKYDEEAVLIPLVSSTGHGHASIKRLFYFNGKFSAASILAVVRIKDKTKFLPQFIYYYLTAHKEDKIVSLMKGAANVSLSIKKIQSIKVPLINIEEQKRLINRLIEIQNSINGHKTQIRDLEILKDEELKIFERAIK